MTAWISSMCFGVQTFFALIAWCKNIDLLNMHIPPSDFHFALGILWVLIFGECIQMFKHKIAVGRDASNHPASRGIGVFTGVAWIVFALLLWGGFQSEVTDRLLGDYLLVFVAFLVVFNITVIVSNVRKTDGETPA